MVAEKGARIGTNYKLEADSVYFNGHATNLNNVPVNFEKTSAGPKISFGNNYTLYKKGNTDYVLVSDGIAKAVNIAGKNGLDAKENARFTVMLLLLNYIDAYSIKNFTVNPELARIKLCGVWTVMSYGHNSSTASYNLTNSISSFTSNNGNCHPVGSTQQDCFAGSNHICMISQSFQCSCNVTIPFLGIGWD